MPNSLYFKLWYIHSLRPDTVTHHADITTSLQAAAEDRTLHAIFQRRMMFIDSNTRRSLCNLFCLVYYMHSATHLHCKVDLQSSDLRPDNAVRLLTNRNTLTVHAHRTI